MIRKLCTEEAAGGELTNKLTENLKEILCDNKVTVVFIKSVMLGSLHDESASPWSVAQCGCAHTYDSAVCSSPWKGCMWLYPHAKQERNVLKGLWYSEVRLQRWDIN